MRNIPAPAHPPRATQGRNPSSPPSSPSSSPLPRRHRAKLAWCQRRRDLLYPHLGVCAGRARLAAVRSWRRPLSTASPGLARLAAAVRLAPCVPEAGGGRDAPHASRSVGMVMAASTTGGAASTSPGEGSGEAGWAARPRRAAGRLERTGRGRGTGPFRALRLLHLQILRFR